MKNQCLSNNLTHDIFYSQLRLLALKSAIKTILVNNMSCVVLCCSSRGFSCEDWRVQIINEKGKEEAKMAVYWVLNGIVRCQVGFLPFHTIKQRQINGAMGQVTDVYTSQDYSCTKRKKNNENILLYGTCRKFLWSTGAGGRKS